MIQNIMLYSILYNTAFYRVYIKVVICFLYLCFCVSNSCFIFVYYIGKRQDVSTKLHLLAKYSNKLTRSKSEDTCDAICILEGKLM